MLLYAYSINYFVSIQDSHCSQSRQRGIMRTRIEDALAVVDTVVISQEDSYRTK